MQTWQKLAIVGIAYALYKGFNGMGVSAQVERIAKAISVAEGYGVPGAIPTVRNNPGNIRSTSGPIATYPTIEDGWNALYRQVQRMLDGSSSYYDPNSPLTEIAKTYTGEAAYMNWANNVALVLGVPVDTPFKDL